MFALVEQLIERVEHRVVNGGRAGFGGLPSGADCPHYFVAYWAATSGRSET
jgi:hypothetical protein